MKRRLLMILVVCCPLIGMGQEIIDLGSKRELFVDHYLIDKLDKLSLQLHEPVLRDVSFKFDLPWEGLYCGYVTMIHDNGKYRAYYRGGPTDGKDGSTSEALCVAFSDDGIHWTKPKLGLTEKNGSKENNIVMTNIPHLMHNFAPMIDDRPGVPADERYKALSGTIHSGGLFAFSSPDGLVWKQMSDQPVMGKLEQYAYAYDSQNVPLWSPSENCYVVYFRVVLPPFKRYIGRATSKDFLHWEHVETMEVIHDGQPAPFEQFYTNQTNVYFRAPHIYLATPARFMEGRQVLTEEQAKAAKVDPGYFKDCSDAVLLTSRGGNRYDRTFMEPLIRPGIGIQNWVSRTNYPARNIVPTGETEMSLYVNANYATPNSELRRYTLRLDGFASIHAPYEGGTFVSKPLTFSGNKLSLNFSTSAAGGMKVQLEQTDGTPYPGFALDDCKEIIGDEIARDVLWTNGADVSALAGKVVRIRISMKDAELYSLKFEETCTAEGQRYLFLDDHWIKEQSGVTRLFHVAVKDKNNPVITVNNCGIGVGPYTFQWGKKQSPCSAWFGTFEEDTGNYPTSFITSDDGLNWNEACRQTDAIYLGEGSKQCAVHLINGSKLYGDYPYLCATGFRHAPDYNKFHWRFRRSSDGVHWEPFPGDPIWDGPSDVMQIQWDERKNKFVAYYKVWRYKGVTLDGEPFVGYGHLDTKIEGNVFHITGETYLPKQTIDVRLQYGGDTSNDAGAPTDTKMQMQRVIAYAESSDFLHWENEQIILVPPDDAPLGDQNYGMPVTCYGNMYIGMYHHYNSRTGLIQPMVAWSYDGIRFTVNDQQFFITSGKAGEWDYGMILPSEVKDAGNGQLYIYYGSLAVDHLLGAGLTQYHGAFGRAWLRSDGFASLKGGWIETTPLKVRSKQLSVNMTGEISISLKSASGEVVGQKVILRGDHHQLVPDIDLTDWIDKDVIVRLDLSKGELYSITF